MCPSKCKKAGLTQRKLNKQKGNKSKNRNNES